ncbi:MAG: fatty acid desaturase [Gammaproteobacteria bacterium]|nr:fatty acid desaturase [Gammaproteobacteria bacterium]
MTDYRDFVASLGDEQKERLQTRSDIKGVRHLTGHWGLILIVGVYIAVKAPLWQAALLVQGILIIFTFTAMHESIHWTAFRSKWLNGFVANVSGFLICLPPTNFRYFHYAHHRHTHDPDIDPELTKPKPQTRLEYIFYVSGIPEWIYRLRGLFKNALRSNTDTFVPASGKNAVMREARIFLLAYAIMIMLCIVMQSTILIWVWLVPLLFGQPFMRMYLLTEHTLCPHVTNMFENTRTTFTNSVVRLITWNMPYHAEHHTLPTVPFHQLAAFHKLTKEHLAATQQGYARYHRDYFRAAADGSLPESL